MQIQPKACVNSIVTPLLLMHTRYWYTCQYFVHKENPNISPNFSSLFDTTYTKFLGSLSLDIYLALFCSPFIYMCSAIVWRHVKIAFFMALFEREVFFVNFRFLCFNATASICIWSSEESFSNVRTGEFCELPLL